ncbi:MAG: thermonuclease family protein [Rhodospirillales bacterium]|nr:thermonuclease family protein [Rhodospirillales bacterium]
MGARRTSVGLLGALLALIAPPAPAEEISGAARVVDSNTIEIDSRRVRLIGVDAPDLEQACPVRKGGTYPCGRVAAEPLAKLVKDGPLVCQGDKTDAIDRVLARCAIRGFDLGEQFVLFLARLRRSGNRRGVSPRRGNRGKAARRHVAGRIREAVGVAPRARRSGAAAGSNREAKMKKNLLLLAVATILSYVVLEIAWRASLDRVPLTLHKELGRLQWLAQPSKKGIVPKDYVLMIGDSYVEGLGDWLMRVVSDGNPKFNAAHILHDRTGRDVLSFGFRGGSPSWTFVFQATVAFRHMNLYAGIDVAPPADVLAFFYEGNDVNDEISRLRFVMPPDFDRDRAADEVYVREYFRALGAAAAATAATTGRWHPLRNAHLFDTATKLIKLAGKNLGKKTSTLAATDPSFRGGGETIARTGGATRARAFSPRPGTVPNLIRRRRWNPSPSIRILISRSRRFGSRNRSGT